MENNDFIVNNTTYISSDFHPLMLLPYGPGETSNSCPHHHHHHNPRRKRTKFIRKKNNTTTTQLVISNPKPTKKFDPTSPQITRPCTECGRKFWSWKALFGHMRCHPERQWRGIIPPPKFRRPEIDAYAYADDDASSVTSEEHEVAACLLILASGIPAGLASDNHTTTTACTINQLGSFTPEYSDVHDRNNASEVDQTTNALTNFGHFECSSCKKVFGSHQALGGHRASHKNVKGCYAITNSADDGGDEIFEGRGCSGDNQLSSKDNNNNNGHKCIICFRVFSSGQALGGHMRCHWEKVEEQPISRVSGGDFDLNLAATMNEDDGNGDADASFVCSSGLTLDLRLGFGYT